MSLRLNTIVFFTGAAILAMEIVAGRVMQPAFGSSLYIWGAVLSVTLLCLAIGYRWGGAMADRLADPERRLAIFIAASAAWLLALPFMTPLLLRLGLVTGGHLGPIVVALGLFFLPLTLLATSVPLAFGALTKEGESAPATAMGRLFAISTAGSIAGALAAAYGLVPVFGLRKSLFIIAISTAIVAAAYAARGLGSRAITALMLGGLLVKLLPAASAPSFDDGVLVIERLDSSYGHLVVLDDSRSTARILLLDGTAQSIATGPDLRDGLFYAEVIAAAAERHERGRALLLGLGGGILARNLAAMGYQVDAVELDPMMIDVARRHFGLAASDAQVYEADARAFIERAKAQGQSYQLVVVDVAGAGHHPAHVYSLESFEVMRVLLGERGLLAVNMVSTMNPVNDFGQAVMSSLRRAFGRVDTYVDRVAHKRHQVTTLVALASASELEAPAVGLRLPTDAFGDVEPATDDHNPGDLGVSHTNREIRKADREWLGDGIIMPW